MASHWLYFSCYRASPTSRTKHTAPRNDKTGQHFNPREEEKCQPVPVIPEDQMISTTSYRTKLMPLSRAESFARCLAANGAFRDVSVLESGRTKNQEVKWFVNYTPASVEKHRAILQASQDARAARAATERFEFHLSDCGRYHYCLTTQGEVYETTTAHCDCPDAHYRLRGTGLVCKHSLALEAHLSAEASRIQEEVEIEMVDERARYEARMAEDFPAD